jgi:hypothetical protein
MYDSDSDGRITLEEYRNVKYALLPTLPPPLPSDLAGGPRSPCFCSARQVVEELLSGNPHIEKESARSIADGAMMEAASVCVGQMVSAPWGGGREGHGVGGLKNPPPTCSMLLVGICVYGGFRGQRSCVSCLML